MQRLTRAASYAYCERLTRDAAGNFYHAFRLLPGDQRRAMCALYAFLRIADDLADAPTPNETKRADLTAWRQSLHRALEGDYSHPLYPAFHHTITHFGIPVRYLDEVMDGVSMDLDVKRYATFDDLSGYCYCVASAVGLSCIHIWGFRGDAEPYAEAAGLALQLTNILRDVREDVARDRIYLPLEDLDRFGCTEEQLRQGQCDSSFQQLMRFEAERAYRYYEQARPLVPLLSPAGRAVFLVILQTYRGILDGIAARGYEVFRSRVRLPTWRKLWLVVRALPVRFGLVAGG
jgi:phytoene synthase